MHTEVRLFGSPSYRVAGEWRPLPLDKRGALLALLAHAEDGWSRTRLAKLFWPDAMPTQGRVNLRGLLARVRVADPEQRLTLLGERLAWDVQCDSRDFRAAVTDERWLDAIETYTAPFLHDMQLAEIDEVNAWIDLERQQLNSGFGVASDRASEALAAVGDFNAVEVVWRRAGEHDPFDESVVESALRLAARFPPLAVSALRLLERFANRLREEFGVTPTAELIRLGIDLRATAETLDTRESQINGAAPGARRIARSLGVRRSGLPTTTAPVVHRDVEMTQVAALLESTDERCVTIVGPGGIGKTQLALQTARHLATHAYADCWFVPLSEVDSDDSIDAAVAQAVGAHLHGSTPIGAQLLAYLRDRTVLLVLDNLEHLPGSGAFIEKILRACHGVRVLATSRSPLSDTPSAVCSPAVDEPSTARTIGVTYELDGMTCPDTPTDPAFDDHDGVRLFLLRARQAHPSFTLSLPQRADLIAVCRAVGGAPLGIELAAAWVGSMSLPDIARTFDTDGGALDRDLHDVPARHRSLRAAFDQSWRLLTAKQQSALAALSVFSGGFSAEAAEHVSGCGPRTIADLVDWSLVRHVGHGRFDLHPLIRQFATQALHQDISVASPVRDRHAQYFADLVAREGRSFRGGPAQVRALDTVYEDMANVRVAWERARDQRDAAALAAFLPMFHVYEIRGLYREGGETFGLSAAALPDKSKAKALSLTSQSVLLGRQERLAECRSTVDESLAILDELGESDGLTLLHLGVLEYMEGDVDAATATWRRTVAEAERLGDAWSKYGAISNLGVVAWDQGDTTAARALYLEGMPSSAEHEDRWSASMSLVNLGELDLAVGDLESARANLAAALTMARSITQQPVVVKALFLHGRLALAEGDASTAAEQFTRCAEEATACGDEHWLAAAQEQLASLNEPYSMTPN